MENRNRLPAWVKFILGEFRGPHFFREYRSRKIGRRYVVPILVIRNMLIYVNQPPRKRLCIANDNARQ